jgi:hypothetical protein
MTIFFAVFAFAMSNFACLSVLLEVSFASSGAGVPNKACLKALTANWWAGVSGASRNVDS